VTAPAGAGSAPKAPFVLRELRWGDFQDRLAAYYDLYDEVKENPDLGMTLFGDRPDEAEEVAWFGGLYASVLRGETIAVVGEIDGRAAGLVTILSGPPGGRRSETSHVGTLGVLVDRRYRGRGVGEAMLVRALELARGRFDWVRLVVFSVNHRARRLYERLGFRTVGHLEGQVKRNGRYLDEELMSLRMSDWRPPEPGPSP
jgi:RimJ/RimL family protein N-acetyltransferase